LIEFRWYRFGEFGSQELYSMLALRQEILVVEQQSPYSDLDFVDQTASHLLAKIGAELVAYARCTWPSEESACVIWQSSRFKAISGNGTWEGARAKESRAPWRRVVRYRHWCATISRKILFAFRIRTRWRAIRRYGSSASKDAFAPSRCAAVGGTKACLLAARRVDAHHSDMRP